MLDSLTVGDMVEAVCSFVLSYQIFIVNISKYLYLSLFSASYLHFNLLGPVVRTPVSANPGLNFNWGFFIFLSKALFQIIFSVLFRVSNYQIVAKENSTEFAF